MEVRLIFRSSFRRHRRPDRILTVKHFSWNEWITLTVNYSDLPRTAKLAMTIYDCAGPGKLMVVGGTSISLFGKHGMFRQVLSFQR